MNGEGTLLPHTEELRELKRNWAWILVLGIVLVLVGGVASGSSFLTTLATVTWVGATLIVGGGVHLLNALRARRGWGLFLHLLAGVLYVILGVLMLQHPIGAAAAFTLMIAAAFLTGGVLRIVMAIAERFPGWVWVLLNGVVTLALGVLIWREWPESSLWVIGLFVGIDLLLSGWALIMLALAARQAAVPV